MMIAVVAAWNRHAGATAARDRCGKDRDGDQSAGAFACLVRLFRARDPSAGRA